MTAAEPPFARWVRSRMEETGLGLRELCRDAGLDASFFSKVLAGKRSPPAEEEVLRRLAARLGVDPARLVVAAGRVPEEWRRLWSDPALFEAVDALVKGGRPRPSAWDAAPPARVPARAPALEDELL